MRSHTRTVFRALAVGAALTVALSACQTGAEPADEPSESTSPTPQTPADSPETSPSTPPDLRSDVVTNGPNSLTSPAPGATVPGPAVTVTGEGTGFEATLNYRVLVAGTEDLVTEGWMTAGANGEIGPYTFEVTLDPGQYIVQVFEPDMSDGANGDPLHNLVQVTITVQ